MQVRNKQPEISMLLDPYESVNNITVLLHGTGIVASRLGHCAVLVFAIDAVGIVASAARKDIIHLSINIQKHWLTTKAKAAIERIYT